MVAKILPQEVKKMMDNRQPFYLVDMRFPDEFNDIHIKNAINIPACSIERLATRILTDKTLPIVLYCATGNKIAQGAMVLQAMGYQKIFSLGSLYNWPYEF